MYELNKQRKESLVVNCLLCYSPDCCPAQKTDTYCIEKYRNNHQCSSLLSYHHCLLESGWQEGEIEDDDYFSGCIESLATELKIRLWVQKKCFKKYIIGWIKNIDMSVGHQRFVPQIGNIFCHFQTTFKFILPKEKKVCPKKNHRFT